MSGWWLIARTISTICRSASEMSSTSASGIDVLDPQPGEHRLRRLRPCAGGPIRPSVPRGSRVSSRFSATVIQGSRVSSWKTVQAPCRMRVGRTGEMDLPPLEADGAGIGPDASAEDLDQGALAGAVLADQRMDLADARGERGIDQRAHAAEGA